MTETVFEVRMKIFVDEVSKGCFVFESKENYDECYRKSERLIEKRFSYARHIRRDIMHATAKQYKLTEIPF